MPHRAQLALALILVLLLAPLAGATCGIRCLAATPQMHAAISQQRCVRASACCHSTGSSVCSTSPAPEFIAALLPGTSTPHDPPALVVIAANSWSQDPHIPAAHSVDSSPPGQLRTARLISLRV
jgi:hypothetical protein